MDLTDAGLLDDNFVGVSYGVFSNENLAAELGKNHVVMKVLPTKGKSEFTMILSL